MDVMLTTPELKASAEHHVRKELASFFHSRQGHAGAYHPAFAQLWSLASERALGGKLIRPLLMLNMYVALQTDETGARVRHEHATTETEPEESFVISDQAVKVATAIELLHYSFLLHDDVIDGDLTRRGKLNFIGSLVAENDSTIGDASRHAVDEDAQLHWAKSCGILMGNLLLSDVHQVIARLDVPAERKIRLLDLLSHTITESVSGEQLDVGFSDRIVVPETSTVLDMCRLKTATYTFELPLRAAAILAGADSQTESLLAVAGAHLGLAFQLQDDLLSTFGDARVHGKDDFSDLREGKETVVISHARMTSTWPLIEPLFGTRALDRAQGETARELLRSCGSEQFARNLIDEQLRALHEVLADHMGEVSPAVREVLTELATTLEGRVA